MADRKQKKTEKQPTVSPYRVAERACTAALALLAYLHSEARLAEARLMPAQGMPHVDHLFGPAYGRVEKEC